ncbi:MAG: DUF255 domain-containing protein [Burkholderiaceae bacterium]
MTTALVASHAEALPSASRIAWQPYSNDVFARAKASHRYVLLDLEAVWCHWCHVMDATTYHDQAVTTLIAQRFIPVKVDEDSRPDISRRFEIYGWPATILFDGDGNVIAHYRGYREPEVFRHLLLDALEDPSPLHSQGEDDSDTPFAAHPLLSEATRAEVDRRFRESLDSVSGGLKQFQKFLDRDTVEYSLWLTELGDAQACATLRTTLDAARQLIDPVWGGMYQYSTDEDWIHPHFEKIMSVQANALRIYSLAYERFKDPAYLDAAQSIHSYLKNFLLSPNGAFYVSQDADLIPGIHSASYFALDDEHRRKRGVPRVDRHIYARENGWAIEALAAYFSASGDASALDEARGAAKWIKRNRRNHDGSYSHDASTSGGPFLGDSLAMARAFLALYAVTGDPQQLGDARLAARALTRFSAHPGSGFLPALPSATGMLRSSPNIDENIEVARLANLLHRYSGEPFAQQLAENALRYMDTDRIALHFGAVPGILLANAEYQNEPLHITVVGSKNDPAARRLFNAALQVPAMYRRTEWWDPMGPPLFHTDVRFPAMGRATAFVCSERSCSLPLFDSQALQEQVAVQATDRRAGH